MARRRRWGSRHLHGLDPCCFANQRLYRTGRKCTVTSDTLFPGDFRLPEPSIRPPRLRPYLRWFPGLSAHCRSLAPGL